MANNKPEENKVLLTKAELGARYGEKFKQEERERNILMLFKVRPGVFTQ